MNPKRQMQRRANNRTDSAALCCRATNMFGQWPEALRGVAQWEARAQRFATLCQPCKTLGLTPGSPPSPR
eukprot:2904616-Amphidinium_carterae.1